MIKRYEFVLDTIGDMSDFNEYYKQMHANDPLRYPEEMYRTEWEGELLTWWRNMGKDKND